MRISLTTVGAPLVALFLSSCAPLTYSDPGAVDFEQYQAVLVNVSSTSFTGGGSPFLAAKLTEFSGFRSVTTDPMQPVDAVLNVNLEIDYTENEDSEGNVHPSYEATAKYTLVATGTPIDSGKTNASNSDPDEAVDSALEAVAVDYIKPYRL